MSDKGKTRKDNTTDSFFLRRHSLAASLFFSKRLSFLPSPGREERGVVADVGDEAYELYPLGDTNGEAVGALPAATAAVSCFAVTCNCSGREIGPGPAFLEARALLRRLPVAAAAAAGGIGCCWGGTADAPAAIKSSCIPFVEVREPPERWKASTTLAKCPRDACVASSGCKREWCLVS